MAAEHPFGDWIGRERVAEDTVTLDRARKLAATLDLDPEVLRDGDPLPHGWHWIYHHEHTQRSALAEDGHEHRGNFLPPIPLERRMWAGGRLHINRPLHIGSEVRRVSTVRSVELKEGRSGSLAFVTVEHRLYDAEGVAVEDEQDIVYLNRAPAERASPAGGTSEGTGPDTGTSAASADWSETCTLDEVTLFRFSALTFNGHRIHYDRRYAVEIENYPDVVVHGPLLALLLLGAGRRWLEAHTGPSASSQAVCFRYRSLQPAFCNEGIQVCGTASQGPLSDQAVDLWVAEASRGVVMRAELMVGG